MQHLATIFNPFLGTVSLPSSPRLCISTAMVHLGKMLLEVGSLKKNEAENMSTQYKQITNNIYILNVGPYCKHVVSMFELFQGIQRNDKANGRIFGGNRQPQASSRKKIATQGLSNTCTSSTLESSLHCAFFMFLSPQKALAKGCNHLRYHVYIYILYIYDIYIYIYIIYIWYIYILYIYVCVCYIFWNGITFMGRPTTSCSKALRPWLPQCDHPAG